MMLKSTITVALFLQLLLQTECLYPGERCIVDDQNGRCVSLEDCRHVMEEVKMAGSPMPLFIRLKLQKITCGYEARYPMVCCVPPQINSHIPDSSSGEGSMEITDSPDRDGSSNPNDDSINSVGSGDNVEAFTRGTVEKDKEPIPVDNHPNLDLLPLNCGHMQADRILGGNRTSLFEMPWMVLLSYESARGTKLSCGGSLINEWYVLTAAHCVSFLGNRLRLNGVILGEYDIRHDPDCQMSDGKEFCAPKAENVSIASIQAHPGYTPQSLVDDIALIRLAQPANFSLDSMKPLCLPINRKLQDESLVGQFAVVAGWGVTEDGLQSPVLLRVDVPVVSRKDCQAAYNGSLKIRDTQICAGGIKDKDSCGGDSGGPLMYPGVLGNLGVRYIQRGLVSFGPKRCGIGGYPGVYTNIAYYMKWILDHMHS